MREELEGECKKKAKELSERMNDKRTKDIQKLEETMEK
jgi:hypothetical protein